LNAEDHIARFSDAVAVEKRRRLTAGRRRAVPRRRAALAWLAAASLCAGLALSGPGCGGQGREEGTPRERGVELQFDGGRLSDGQGATLVTNLADLRWAAVVDADSRRTAWLPARSAGEPGFREAEPGRKWTASGFVRGPGADISGVLRDNKLMEYEWEIEKADDGSLTVLYSAKVRQHVVLASFSKFTLRFPLRRFLGALVTVDDAFGGTVPRDAPMRSYHPSYWEGPARSLELLADDLSLEIEFDVEGFNWVSLLDGRSLSPPDTFLVLELFPSLSGPHERLGKLAPRGSAYSTSFVVRSGPGRREPPTTRSFAAKTYPPRPLPAALAAELARAGWSESPFLRDAAGGEGPTFGDAPRSCELALKGRRCIWTVSTSGEADPVPVYLLAAGPVRNLRIKTNGEGDFADTRELLRDIGALAEEPPVRAERIWRYAARRTYTMPLHPTADLGEFLGSYGYGFSSTLSATALVKLWADAGLPARRVFLSGARGYALAEAFYDGGWRAYDLAERTYYVRRDGNVASAQDLVDDPELVSANSDASGAAPGGELAREAAAERYDGASISYNAAAISLERRRSITLRRGEILFRAYGPLGKPAPSPRVPDSYANALLAFVPDLTDEECISGFSSVDNLRHSAGALVVQDPSSPASLEYSARTPYVITEAHLEISATPGVLERATVLLSVDGGGSWLPVNLDSESGSADLTPLLVPGPQPPGTAYEKLDRNFGYDVHLEIAPAGEGEEASVMSFEVFTWCQANPAFLPRLAAGENEVLVECEGYGGAAAASLGWIEPAVRVSPRRPSPGDSVRLAGTIVDLTPESHRRLRIVAYGNGSGGSLLLGSCEIAPGSTDRAQFDFAAGPICPAAPGPGGRTSECEMTLRIEDDTGSPLEGLGAVSVLRVPLAEKPDLVVRPELVSFRAAAGPEGEAALTAIVRNFCPTKRLLYMQGTPSGPTELQLVDESVDPPALLAEAPVPALPPGGHAAVTLRWKPAGADLPPSLLLVVDPRNKVQERDERNSVAVRPESAEAG